MSNIPTHTPMFNAQADSHCHIGVSGHLQDPQLLIQRLQSSSGGSSQGFFNVMSTNHLDIEFLAKLIDLDSTRLLAPFFGIHPWYSHLFSVESDANKTEHYNQVIDDFSHDLLQFLPEPIYLEKHIERIKLLVHKCERLGIKCAIGEIGLDKLFRIPSNGFYGNQEFSNKVSLTSARVSMRHQELVFKRQLRLAEELKKPVSLHCVKAHGPFFDSLSASHTGIPCVVLHSYTGSTDQALRWKKTFQKQMRMLKFSFSNYINGKNEKADALAQLVRLLDADQLLVETDFPIDHYFLEGHESEYFDNLESIKAKICRIIGLNEIEFNGILQQNANDVHRG